ncbi:MAG: putative cytokinetic ring protein SteA [Acidimicrobiales bacterium]
MTPANTSLGDPSSRFPPEVVTGRVRSGHNTTALVRRLHHGEIAVIDHADIDRETAQALAGQRVAAVINAADSITGRYPHEGPLALVERGIPLIDGVGEEIFARLHDGLQVAIVGNHVLVGDERVATGRRQTPVTVRARMEVAERGLDDQIGLFAVGALEYLRDQDVSLTQLSDMPDLQLSLRGRQVLVVASGLDDQDDLAVLRGSGYIQEQRPFVIGVDTGADVLLDQGVSPDLVIGELTDVSDEALQAADLIIAHGHGDEEPDGMARLAISEVEHHWLSFDGSSMDAAMLLAQERGADLIVAVGSHPSLDDFLGQDRALIATRMVTRLRVGHILVDARGVSRIYRREVRKRDLLLLVSAAIFTLIVLFIVSEPLRLIVRGFRLTF